MRRFRVMAVVGLGVAGVLTLVGVAASSGSADEPSASVDRTTPAATSSADTVESHRLAGAHRFETAALVARERMPDHASELYVATGLNFPDALAAGAAAGVKGAPVVLTGDTLPGDTRTQIERLDPADVYVTGGPAAVSEQAVEQLEAVNGGSVQRLAGSERMATAAALAEDAFSAPVPVAYVATGAQFADALAGGAAAAVEDGPLLLTAGEQLPEPTQAALSRLQPERIVVLGGTAAVSETVAEELELLTDGPVERRAGSNRFATAAQISRATFDEAETVYLATGEDFPDALAGAPAAAVDGAPLLLVGHGLLPDEVAAELERLAPCTVVTLGGAAAISEDVEDDAVAAAQRGADEQGGCTGDAGADHDRPGQDRQPAVSCDDVHHVVTGDQPDGFTVPAGECWEIEGEVTTPENVVVLGGLKMRSGATLTFIDIDEDEFVGGGMDVQDADIGLWVMDEGVLDIQGSEKRGWDRAWHNSWTADDEVRRVPFHKDEEETVAHGPDDTVPCVENAGREVCAELINLTRDVTIQGRPDGRSHVFIHSDAPQIVRHATIRHVGVGGQDGASGRYGLHFHHSRDGSRGSVIEGVVIRDSGSHAFVPHASHGIMFTDTIAYDVVNSAYWWDPDDRDSYPRNASHDTTYERAVAVQVNNGYQSNQSLHGFYLAQGEDNRCLECVAVAVGAQSSGRHRESSGFYAPRSGQSLPNAWELRDLVSHNNRANGMMTRRNRQRLEEPEPEGHVQGFTAYRNANWGVHIGPYRDNWSFTDVHLFDNRREPVRHRTPAGGHFVTDPVNTFTGVMDAGGAEYAVQLDSSGLETPDDVSVVWKDLALAGWSEAPILSDISNKRNHDFVNVTAGGQELEPDDFDVRSLEGDTLIRVQRSDGTAFAIDEDGVREIDPFYP